MARLGPGELVAIREKATEIRHSLLTTGQALPLRPPARTLLGAPLAARFLAGIERRPFDFRAVRAIYHAEGKSIELKAFPSPYVSGDADVTVEDAAAFEQWITHALAHEVCHLLQHRADPCLFAAGGQGAEAHRLSVVADKTKDWGDYVAYVSHPLEREAHATQMAVEIAVQHPRLDEDGFRALAAASDLARHVGHNPEFDSATRAIHATNLEALLRDLIDTAWDAYEAIMPPEDCVDPG